MKKYSALLITLAFLLISSIPASASAATVYLESSKAALSVGDTAIISVKVNAEATTINTVEGDVSFKAGAPLVTVQEFSLANSAFGLWPRTPSLSTDGRTISFVGGVPGGFNIEGATLFKIIVVAKKEGTVTLSPQNIAVYANDGKGTKLAVQTKDLTIQVGPKKAGVANSDEWGSIVAADKTAPEDFIVVLGQDPGMFDGKKFAFFSAVDNQSGISHYEVSENGAPAVRSGSTYVLKDQVGPTKLDVVAYDKANNKKAATYVPASKSGFSWWWIVIIVIAAIIARIVYKKWRKNKANAAFRVQ